MKTIQECKLLDCPILQQTECHGILAKISQT